jgi:type I site-specific restriction endonuclease
MNPLSRLLLVGLLALLAGCSSVYYGTMEKMGYAKRDILVTRVEKAQEAQEEAKEQFATTLDQFLAVAKIDGGELKQKYDRLNDELQRCESRAKAVHEQIAAIDDVAGALFDEWGNELTQYSSDTLRAQSQQQLANTRVRYGQLMTAMRQAASRMEPILVTFRDQVLFLKHNLNAQALRSLDLTSRSLQADIAALIRDMEKSIREAETFIREMQPAA